MENLEKFATQVVQLTGSKEGAVSPAIVQSAAFAYGNSETGENIFNAKVKKPLYARMGNPTNTKLETILTSMDEGCGTIVTSSGMGAISMAVMSIVNSGDEIISIGGLFGGTYSFFSETASRFGVKTRFFDVDQIEDIKNAVNGKTKIIFVESVGNPSMSLADIPAILDLANKHNIISIVDNTLTPVTLQPLKLGADICVYSTTKIIAGNASALGGAAVFREALQNDEKLLGGRYPFYKKFIDKAKASAMVMAAKKRALRDLGMSASAFSSYLTILGLETLPLRIERINSNITKIVKALDKAGLKINHPSLPGHKHHKRYKDIYHSVTGSLFTIEFETKQKAFEFLNNSKLITITANVSDSRTLGLHMASTIYSDFTEKEKEFLGITKGLVRISIGQENPDEIINDILQAVR
jgi:O-acetylhomoserine (thiol)-lyase